MGKRYLVVDEERLNKELMVILDRIEHTVEYGLANHTIFEMIDIARNCTLAVKNSTISTIPK